MTDTSLITRRTLIWGSAALGGLALLGCSSEGSSRSAAKPKATRAKLTMYKDPNCGCCGKWGEQARAAGLDVTIVETSDIQAFKRKLGVPEQLYACHTTVAGPYVIEGHVPFDAVKRLLDKRPRVKGIAVPGMPLGSPGMDVPGAAAQPIKVLAFDTAGKISAF